MQRRFFHVLITALLAVTSFSSCVSQTSPDLQIIKQRVVSDLIAHPVNETAVRQLVKSIRPDGTWPGINYEDTSRTGFQHKDHLENMLALAQAYRKPGSPLYHDEAVKTTFSNALDSWLKHDFRCANWWWNEM